MANIKHVGRIRTNKRRAIVAYRTIPGDPYSALVVLTEALPADEHDSLMKLVESATGQQANELADAMSRAWLPDGRNMLAGFHRTGQLKKVATKDIEMTPNSQTTIVLSELNELIAQQKGVSIEDLAVKDPNAAKTKPAEVPVEVVEETPVVNDYVGELPFVEEVAPVEAVAPVEEVQLTEAEMAAKLRSTADALFKEAQALRKQAEALIPTKKKVTAKKTESAKA